MTSRIGIKLFVGRASLRGIRKAHEMGVISSVVRPTLLYISSEAVIPAKAGIQPGNTGFPRIKYGTGLVKPGMTIKVKGLLTQYTSVLPHPRLISQGKIDFIPYSCDDRRPKGDRRFLGERIHRKIG